MATEYKGVPIGSLPEATSLNSSDELIAYRGGQAYRSDVGHLGETANGNISDAFSTSKSYAVGDYCIYNDTLYKCTTAHDKASWNSSHFEAVTVGEELSELNTNSQILSSDVITTGTFTATSSTNIPANDYQAIEIPITVPDGCECFGILQCTAANGSVALVRMQIDTGEAIVGIHNCTSSAQNCTPTVTVLFVRRSIT